MITKLLIAAAMAAALATPAAAANPLPDADPALWRVSDEDTTIYLFGTFHALDGKAEWFNDEVKMAFDRSDELVLETLAPEDPAKMQSLVAKYATDKSGKPLSAKLSPAGRKAMAAALAELGAPPAAFDRFKPYFASIAITAVRMQKLGFAVDKGAEQTLKTAAKAARKRVGQLESPASQMAMFDRIPEQEQILSLEQLLGNLDRLPQDTQRMLTAWNRGDVAGFKAIMDGVTREGPKAHKVIFSDRNAEWADWIDKRMDDPGTVFIAVGMGHLAGKDSVQKWLARRNIAVHRAG
jgi:uncharacterized protein YbaP (TraB family)